MASELHPWKFELDIFSKSVTLWTPTDMYLSPNWMLSSVRSVKHFFQNALVPTTSLWLGPIDSLPLSFSGFIFKRKSMERKLSPLSTFHCNQLQHTRSACFKICQTTFNSILFKSLLSHVGQLSCHDVTEVTWPKPRIFSCRQRSCSKHHVYFHLNQYFYVPQENVNLSNEQRVNK